MDLSSYRFYVPDLSQQEAGDVVLPEDQAHHLRAVLRLEAGAGVILFDGQGAWGAATMTRVGKSHANAKLEQPLVHDPRPRPQLTLATAVPKGERAEWLVEQASQLNVAAIQWVDCARSVVKPREGGGKLEKWRRLAVESAKQCGRTHVMRVEEMVGLGEVLAGAARTERRVLWLDPRSEMSVQAALAGRQAGAAKMALIGPEGGWSEEECRLLEGTAGLQRVRLTATVLRIETACAAVAAVVMTG